MLTFRCAPLLFKESALPPMPLPQTAQLLSPFDGWCIHRFYRAQAKYWLFVHSETFFSFTIQSQLREGLSEVLNLFRKELAKILFYEEFTAAEIACVLQSLEGPLHVEGTLSKGMQRSLDILAGHYLWFTERAERVQQKEPESICLHVNETPLEMIEHHLPAEAFRQRVEQAIREKQKVA